MIAASSFGIKFSNNSTLFSRCTGIRLISAIMETCQIESGVQLLSRINERPADNLKFPIFPVGPFQNQIIEITGGPATGKTLLLMDFIVKCVLPKHYDGINFPGNSKSAILINTDHQINLFNLIDLIELTVKPYVRKKANDLIESCLKNITILNCYSSEQLRFTFLNLEKILQQNGNTGIVALDSLSAYYWADRLDLGIVSFNAYCSSVLDDLKKAVKDFGVVTFFTRPEVESVLKNNPVRVDSHIRLKESGDNSYEATLQDGEKIVKTAKYIIKNSIVFV